MWDWITTLTDLKHRGTAAVVVTLVQCKGSTPREVGAKMVVLSDGQFLGTIGGGSLEYKVLQDAKRCFETRQSKVLNYQLCANTGQCCGGVVDVLMEVINMEPTVYIFGAGHVGQALSAVLLGTPFQVHVSDGREEWLSQLPRDVERHPEDWQTLVDKIRWEAHENYAVVMTHSHQMDQDIIGALMERPLRYLGLIGSRNKWLDFQLHLAKQGKDQALFSRVRCPIGLEIGGKSPQEVALSIAAELVKTYHEQE